MVIGHWSLVIGHWLRTFLYYLLPITYYLLPITYYLLPITYCPLLSVEFDKCEFHLLNPESQEYYHHKVENLYRQN